MKKEQRVLEYSLYTPCQQQPESNYASGYSKGNGDVGIIR